MQRDKKLDFDPALYGNLVSFTRDSKNEKRLILTLERRVPISEEMLEKYKKAFLARDIALFMQELGAWMAFQRALDSEE
jgi:hypothetical protein